MNKSSVLSSIRSKLGAIRANYRGRRVDEKLVIIESDDWGAIRTPSSAALKRMQQRGYIGDDTVYSRDALETSDDLERLFEVLTACLGRDGKPAVLTANTIVANPDFAAIKSNDFNQYFYEPATTTCQRDPATQRVPELWKEGMDTGSYCPQFHGREHLHYQRWLNRLKSGDKATRYCFSLGSTSSGKGDYSFMEALDWDHPSELEQQGKDLSDGLHLFEQIFDYRPASFIAPCFTWDPALDPVLAAKGIIWLQGTRVQICPAGSGQRARLVHHWFGETNCHGQRYNVRNVHFEPVVHPDLDVVDRALAQISIAFRMKRPAVINSHRVNYVGSIDSRNADLGLSSLKRLLTGITRRWPDARFISTDQLSSIAGLQT